MSASLYAVTPFRGKRQPGASGAGPTTRAPQAADPLCLPSDHGLDRIEEWSEFVKQNSVKGHTMAIEIGQDRQSTSAPKDQQPRTAEALARVVDRVRRDAEQDTERYLDETTVPHGGE